MTLTQPEARANRALVVGNQSYLRGALDNSRKDASDVAGVLKQLGFEVTLVVDTGARELAEAVDRYASTVQPGDVSFFYYSGHGIQSGGENYLIPTDFSADKEEDVPYAAYALGRLLGRLEKQAPALSVIVLDACRDNPFLKKRGGGGGLAGIEAARGTLVSYATSAGQTASDGVSGGNGLYTSALLRRLTEPDVDVDAVFKRVREDVNAASHGRQVPWTSTSVIGTFCFAGSGCGQNTPPAANPVPSPPAVRTLPAVKAETRKDKKSGEDYVRLPAGALHLGCEPDDHECYGDEKPGSEARISAVWLGRTEVTAAAYARCLKSGACAPAGTGKGCNGDVAGYEEHPINCVDWSQASAYCHWLGGRLPSGAEWEAAAKSGGGHLYPWGSDAPVKTRCVYYPSTRTSPVASFPAGASNIGLMDLAGNVSEWTSEQSGESHEYRGGAFDSPPRLLRASARKLVEASLRAPNLGFRCAKEK
jgi:formylglycine-generating enzyme required for sulfatase activity